MALTEAQQTLADTMSEISELCWFAGWLNGTEYRLWRFMTDPGDDEVWGTYPIPPEYRDRLEQLSKAAGGWIYWRDEPDVPDEEAGPTFVAKADWKVVYDAWRQTWQDNIEAIKRSPRRYVDYADWFARQAKKP